MIAMITMNPEPLFGKVGRGQCFSSYQMLLVWLNYQEKDTNQVNQKTCHLIVNSFIFLTWSTTSKHIPFEVSPNCLYWFAIRLNSLRQSIQLLPALVSLVLKHFIKSTVLFRISITFLFNLQTSVIFLVGEILSGSHASTKQPNKSKERKYRKYVYDIKKKTNKADDLSYRFCAKSTYQSNKLSKLSWV